MVTIKKHPPAFTIVELLIVIVVIGILAAISIVAYNGIQSRARNTGLVSDARQAVTQLDLIHADTGSYPTDANAVTVASGSTKEYIRHNDNYCFSVSNSHGSYYVTNLRSQPEVGPCPVGHWAMNGNANDWSIYENHGIVSGATLVSDRGGKVNSAFSFGASHNRIMMQNGIPSSNQMTAATWYRRDDSVASTSWRTILAPASANIHPLIINSTTRQVAIFDGATRNFNFVVPNDGSWYHLAVVYNTSATSASLYVNGSFDSTAYTTMNFTVNPISQIGNWGGGGYWAGLVDDVRIYNRALSANEIRQLYEVK